MISETKQHLHHKLVSKTLILFSSAIIFFIVSSILLSQPIKLLTQGKINYGSYGVFVSLWVGLFINLSIIEKRRLKEFGFNGGLYFWKPLFIGISIILGLQFMMEIITSLIELFFGSSSTTIFALKPWTFEVGERLIYFFLVGLTEEAVFRGYLFTIYREKHGFIKSATTSSLIFSMIHLINPSYLKDPSLGLLMFLFAFLLAVYFCYLFSYFKNIWYLIGIHFGFDFGWTFWELIFNRSINSIANDSILSLIVMNLMVITAFGITHLIIKKKENKRKFETKRN